MKTGNFKRLIALPTLAGLVLACFFLATAVPAGARPKTPKEPAVFFPPEPALPRVQYLASFNGRKQIEKQSRFNKFVVGARADKVVDKPYGVAMHEGKLYVCDTNASVAVFDFKARTFKLLKGAIGPGTLRQPINISIEADGTKYVADPVRGQVVVFDRNDAYVKAFGIPDKWRPVDAVAYEDRLYVVDTASNLIKVLDKRSGEMLKTIGDKGEPTERLDRPTNLAIDREGYLYVTDFGRFQVLKFDRDGHLKATFGKAGDNLGHFARPKGISVDREGRLFVVDAAFNNVQIFSRETRMLMFLGQGGERPGDLLLPAKVAIDYDNLKYFEKYLDPSFAAEYLIVVTSQVGERRVNVFAYGRQKGKTYPTDAELLKEIEERAKKETEKAR